MTFKHIVMETPTRVAPAEDLNRCGHLYFTDLLVFLLLGCSLQSLPRKAPQIEVHKHVPKRLQVIPSTLLWKERKTSQIDVSNLLKVTLEIHMYINVQTNTYIHTFTCVKTYIHMYCMYIRTSTCVKRKYIRTSTHLQTFARHTYVSVHTYVPIPRWVLMLAYLAVPVRFLFSL